MAIVSFLWASCYRSDTQNYKKIDRYLSKCKVTKLSITIQKTDVEIDVGYMCMCGAGLRRITKVQYKDIY